MSLVKLLSDIYFFIMLGFVGHTHVREYWGACRLFYGWPTMSQYVTHGQQRLMYFCDLYLDPLHNFICSVHTLTFLSWTISMYVNSLEVFLSVQCHFSYTEKSTMEVKQVREGNTLPVVNDLRVISPPSPFFLLQEILSHISLLLISDI
jgi:hypothetical protein